MDKIRRIGIRADLAKHQHKMEIKALEAENKRLRESLNKIAVGNGTYGAQAFEYKQIARAALEGKDHDQA